MNPNAMKNALKFLIPLAALGLTACDVAPQQATGEPPLQGATIGGPFELTDSEGETRRWSDFDGKYRIVYFGFAYCPDICPTDMARMAAGLGAFTKESPALGKNIQPIFITIDPERDTPEVVGEFISNFPGDIIGLTGTKDQIGAAADTFGVYFSESEDAPGGFAHSRVTYLFDRDGKPITTLPTDQGSEAVKAELAKWVR
jgi:protein SCO1/2